MEQTLPAPEARVPPVLPEHLIEETLVRVASPRDLVRASAAFPSFRRLVTDATFLRRYRSLHPPVLLGVLTPWGFLPAEAPNPNARAAGALDHAADFSPDYLPRRGQSGWYPCDARDGRVLRRFVPAGDLVLPELAVCDPLTRGHTLLPPIPDNLVASVLGPVQNEHVEYFDAFFVPSGDYDEEHFRVIGWTYCEAMAVAFVYSSLSGTWTAGASTSWDALHLIVEPPMFWWPSYVYGCFYWKVPGMNKLLKLDPNRLEFSAVGLSPNHENPVVAVVEAGEGRIGILSHIQGLGNGIVPQFLRYSILQNEGGNVNERPTIIPPSNLYDKYFIVAAAEGYVFLQSIRFFNPDGTRIRHGVSSFLTLEIKTLKIERFCSTRGGGCDHILPYFGFPPFMSPRRI